jgi:two-component system chemotaxis sensor kinase CheA
MTMTNELLEEFLQETNESLENLDTKLIKLEENPNDNEVLSDVFRVMHTIKGTAGFLNLNRMVAVAHSSENILDKYREGATVTTDGVSIILAAIDSIKDIISDIDLESGKEPDGNDEIIIDLLNDLADSIPTTKTKNKKKSTERNSPTDKNKSNNADEKNKEAFQNKKNTHSANQTVKTNVSLLDTLMDLVGELVLARNQILQVEKSYPGNDLSAPVQNLSSITSELQDTVLKTRMQPISTAFNIFPRVVRDLATQLNKKIDLKLIGGETDVDRQVADLIKDPLTHMIRNCSDHAIESAEERLSSGKNEAGNITLNAYHEGGHIIIKVSDDGRGISVDKVAQKAIDKGVITQEQRLSMTNDRIRSLIFDRGFSTADEISEVSGRGVGMDAVRDNIEKIGGTISVESEEGVGTEFSIKIPLTLAIISSFVVGIGNLTFAIPQINALEILDLNGENGCHIDLINGSPLLRLRNNIYPIIDVGEFLKIDNATRKTVILCQIGAEIFGILVDKVLNTEEIVVKPLSKALQDTTVYSGNTILGDGSVIMILDPAGLFSTFGIPARVSSEIKKIPSNKTDEDAIQMMLFSTQDFYQKAVHMSVVTRIDQIKTELFQRISDNTYLIQQNGKLMPVICPGSYNLDSNREIQRVIVFKDEGKSMGFLVDRIFEIAETRVNIDVSSQSFGTIGTAVIKGNPTEILDVSYFIDDVSKNWFKDLEIDDIGVKDASVLIVDDSHFFRSILLSMLTAKGYRADVASSPIEALEMLNKNEYNILVSDIEMPDMSGIEFIKKIRSEVSKFQNIPAIAITSHNKETDKEIGLAAGFNEYLAKTDKKKIFDFLKENLGQREI